MFEALSWVGVQDETYGERFRTLGTASSAVSVTGSVKWDTADVTDHVPGADDFARATGLDVTRPIWVCGSTGPGEEPVILDAYRQIRQDHADLQLVIVPRKPERFDEVAGHIERAGYTCARRSRHGDSTGPATNASADSVVLGDTMGELRKIYTLANVVFVGRSLADMGGSDMMEVAALAKPVVVGPHTENFADTMKRLRAGDAIREIDRDLDDDQAAHYLAQAVGELLSDRSLAERLAANGRRVVQENRGATQRTVAALLELLDRAQHAAS
jgi:3-deoxy-D-manno-octulosonic-acid transferase